MIMKGLQSINLAEKSSGMCGVMLLLLGCGPWGILSGTEADAITSKALNDFVQSVRMKFRIIAMAGSASGIAGI